MPIYRYRNLTTNETFDLEQRITESALTQHPETGDPVKRLIQPVGIAFKGSGFYVNDSRSSKSASSKDGSKVTRPRRKRRAARQTWAKPTIPVKRATAKPLRKPRAKAARPKPQAQN